MSRLRPLTVFSKCDDCALRKTIKSLRPPFVFIALIVGLSSTAAAAEYAIGADVSFLKQEEAQGTAFKDHDVARPGLQIFKDHGYNWVRLRLFNSPPELPNNLEYTLALAKEAKRLGFKFLLDFHYSDTWADPGKQFLPKAWEGKTHDQLVHLVFAYTRDTLATFRTAGVMPDMVQPGNEITEGMLWPDGRLPARWDAFAELLKAGVDGIKAEAGARPAPLIMIHIDRGGDQAGTRAFFDKLNTYHIPYDIIGLSYYPKWHGPTSNLRQTLDFVANTYPQDVIVVEAAYSWKPADFRDRPAPFPESPEGQRAFWEEVNHIVKTTPHGKGKGVFWWEPAVMGELNHRAMFDEAGNALPVLAVFDPLKKNPRLHLRP